MADKLYRRQDTKRPRYARAEDAERKVRAWDVAGAAGVFDKPGVYSARAKRMRGCQTLMDKEPAWRRLAAATAELAAALRAIEEADGEG